MAGTFEIHRDRRDGFSFRLRTRQGQIVATGGSFPSQESARRGVATLLLAAAGAQIEDQTKSQRPSIVGNTIA